MQQTLSFRGLCQRWGPAAVGPRRSMSVAVHASQADIVKQTIADNKVVVYSKTYCPYCTELQHLCANDAPCRQLQPSNIHIVLKLPTVKCDKEEAAKGLFQKLSVPAKVIELDVAGGSDLQLGVQEVTGRRTVPQVFVGGKHVGGCDDTMAAYSSGKLKEMLAEVGYQI